MNAPDAIGRVPIPARERGRIAPAKLAHVVLKSANKDRLVAFYKTLLEAEATFGDNNATFLTYDEEHHRIAVIGIPGLGRNSRRRVGVDHIAFTYASLGDLLATYERLKAAGIRPVWTTHHGATLSFYYQDPDNNFCELQIDVFETPEELEAYFNSGDFNVNPVGVDFDPEDVLARYRNGESRSTLLKRVTEGPHNPAAMPRAYLGTFHWLMFKVARLLGKQPGAG